MASNNSSVTPTINNVSYSWSMIELTSSALTGMAGSQILNGVSAIKYSKKQNIKTNYGLGGEPIGRGFGNIECSASITMDYNTQVSIRGGRASLREIGEFDLTISFGNLVEGQSVTQETVVLKGCIFDEDGFEANQDDTNLTHEFDLHPYKILLMNSAGA